MSEGESRWPLSWRERNTTGVPAIWPRRSGADGSPHGLLIVFCRTFRSPGRWSRPDPPMTPSTALVIATRGQTRAGLESRRARVRPPSSSTSGPRIFARRARLELAGMQFHLVPHLLFGEVEQAGEHDQENEHLHADALPRLEVRLGRPH